jgi:DNA adenine methylase
MWDSSFEYQAFKNSIALPKPKPKPSSAPSSKPKPRNWRIDPLPYVYFGGKRSIAFVVWERLGDVKTYVEPFFGGGAVFWLRPPEHFAKGERRWELLNDIDGFIVNFLRAVCHDPHAVAHYADWFITELDLRARHIWLINQQEKLVQRLEADPEYYDAKIAGWWVWGINNFIGGEWCSGNGAWTLQDGVLAKRTNPKEKGINKSKPQIGSEVHGYQSVGVDLVSYFENLSQRLKGNICKIICGDWKRCLTPSCTIHSGVPVGVFLDPPYAGDRDIVYAHDDTSVCFEVLGWCKEKGKDSRFRIALCGYTGYYDELESLGWMPYYWSANGGYGNQSQKRGRVNKHREVVWFSPHCLQPVSAQQLDLF